MRLFLKVLLGVSALFIAGCSAYFSVLGLGLLFIGSATAVMVMAASLELGKLVAASFLYQYWSRITIPVRLYLMVAVVVLICVSSLGIYGYLARAYERTNSQVALLEQQAESIQAEIADIQARIGDSRTQIGRLSEAEQNEVTNLRRQIEQAGQSLDQALTRLEDRRKAARDKRDKALEIIQQQSASADKSTEQSLARLEERRKAAREKRDRDAELIKARAAESATLLATALAAEDAAIDALHERLAVLDRAVDAYTREGGAGFLKEDKIRKGQLLREEQQPQRNAIAAQIAKHREAAEQHRKTHAAAVAGVDQKLAELAEPFTRETAEIDAEDKALRKALAEGVAAAEVKTAAVMSDFGRDTGAIDQEEQALRAAHAQAVAADQGRLDTLQAAGKVTVADGSNQIEGMHQRIRKGNEEIQNLREQIAATDVGSYRFVARAFNAQVDDVVKWLMIVIVLVFDPLAVALTIGFNIAVMGDRRPGGASLPAASGDHRGRAGEAEPLGAASTAAAASSSSRVVAITGAAILGAALLGGGAFLLINSRNAVDVPAYTALVPRDAFAVAAISPAAVAPPANTAPGQTPEAPALLGHPAFAGLSAVFQRGFDPGASLYAFLKYPSRESDKPADRPTIICGLVARVTDPVAAEAALSSWADQMDRTLRPTTGPRASLTHNRVMIRFGQGRYLDPDRGFFTYGLTAHEAVVLIEIEGDPGRSHIEDEIRLRLSTATPTAGKTTASADREMALPIASDGAVAIWFDGKRCFENMPQSAAAQARYQQLQSFLDFRLRLTIAPVAADQIRFIGRYQYDSDRFTGTEKTSAMQVLARLGSGDAAGTPGQLMDRCADTLDFDSLIDRLRLALSGAEAGTAGPEIVVEKSTDSPRQARFVLTARFDPSAGWPMAAAFRSISPF